MQGCSGKHAFLQCHGGPGALCAWLMRELWSCPAPGWESCRVGKGSSLCLGVGAVGRQNPSRVSKARQRLEGSPGSTARCAAGARPHWESHPQPGTGKPCSCFSAAGKFLLLHVIYWKVAALSAGVPGGAKRITSGNGSAGEKTGSKEQLGSEAFSCGSGTSSIILFFF